MHSSTGLLRETGSHYCYQLCSVQVNQLWWSAPLRLCFAGAELSNALPLSTCPCDNPTNIIIPGVNSENVQIEMENVWIGMAQVSGYSMAVD